nr:hypothetical protein [Tanacetum cinerariifolium]
MATTIDQQVALDEALVPNMQRLRIGRSNFRLPSDIQSKESTLQVVYDVLRNSPFFRAFIVTEDVPEVYMTMATTIEQQTALDESLVPSTQRLRIGRSNFRLPSDIQSKEATLQVVYDVLRNSSLFRAFQVTVDVSEIYMQEFWATAKLHHNSIRFKIDTRKMTTDVPEIYMQEFWATAKLHQHSIRVKMDTRKSVLDMEVFREMLHISPRILSQSFAELPFKEEI